MRSSPARIAGRRPYRSEEAAPHRCYGQLRYREGGNQQPYHGRVGAKLGGVERQEGHDHREPHHIHERR